MLRFNIRVIRAESGPGTTTPVQGPDLLLSHSEFSNTDTVSVTVTVSDAVNASLRSRSGVGVVVALAIFSISQFTYHNQSI